MSTFDMIGDWLCLWGSRKRPYPGSAGYVGLVELEDSRRVGLFPTFPGFQVQVEALSEEKD